MTNILKGIIPAFVVALAFAACDKISEGDRYIYVKQEAAKRTVLIEDFTGQMCSNCPTAIEVIDSLQAELGDTAVIAVGIHSGPFGFAGNSKYKGLMTDLGNTYYNHWSIPSQPMGVIDRLGTVTYQMWKTTVYKELTKEAPLNLYLLTDYNDSTRTVNIGVGAVGTNGDTQGKLQVWLVEDSIVGIQTLPDGSYDFNYTHNHVLRATVNGDWGTDISVTDGKLTEQMFQYTLPEDWVAKNVSVVAFVYKNDGTGVQQAAKRHVIDRSEEVK